MFLEEISIIIILVFQKLWSVGPYNRKLSSLCLGEGYENGNLILFVNCMYQKLSEQWKTMKASKEGHLTFSKYQLRY